MFNEVSHTSRNCAKCIQTDTYSDFRESSQHSWGRLTHISLALKQGWDVVAHPSLTLSLAHCFYSVNLPSRCHGSVMPHHSLFPPLRSDLFADWTNYLHEFSPWEVLDAITSSRFQGPDQSYHVHVWTQSQLGNMWTMLTIVGPTYFYCQRDDSTTMVAVKQNWAFPDTFLPIQSYKVEWHDTYVFS